MPCAQVMSWAGVLPRAQLVSLLEDHFFPKWHAVLQHWLAHSPDYDEVTAWYLGWKVHPLPPQAAVSWGPAEGASDGRWKRQERSLSRHVTGACAFRRASRLRSAAAAVGSSLEAPRFS